jgi:hypothetical protein
MRGLICSTCAAPATVSRYAHVASAESIAHWIVTDLGRGFGETCSPETGREGGVSPRLNRVLVLFSTGLVAVGDDDRALACL